MNFDRRFSELKNRMDDLFDSYNEARGFTKNFLECCERNGIDTVSICTRTELIKQSEAFPFSEQGSVFAEGRLDGCPAIWRVASQAGVHGGCGNTDQAQLNAKGKALLIDGVYRLKDGAWERVGE